MGMVSVLWEMRAPLAVCLGLAAFEAKVLSVSLDLAVWPLLVLLFSGALTGGVVFVFWMAGRAVKKQA